MIPRVGAERPRLVVVTDAVVASTWDSYMSLKAAAAYTSLSVRLLRSFIGSIRAPLPCYRVGGRVLLRKSDLDAYLFRYRQERSVGAARTRALVDEVVNAVTAGRRA